MRRLLTTTLVASTALTLAPFVAPAAYASPACTPPSSILTTSNVVCNGDAELSGQTDSTNAGGDTVVPVLGWTVTGYDQGITGSHSGLTVVKYGTYTVGNPANAGNDGGTNYFSGGQDSNTTLGNDTSPFPTRTASQTIAVPAGDTTGIDSGNATFNLSAELGGYSSQDDNAKVVVTFLDGSSAPLGSPTTIGPVLASDRSNVTTLLATTFSKDHASGSVPISTRSIRVDLVFERRVKSYLNGYADNISLTLTGPTRGGGGGSTPEAPSAVLFGAGAVALLAVGRRLRRRATASGASEE